MSAPPPFYVYIDESGDEGFTFDKGSSEWFVLAACLVREANDRKLGDLVDGIRSLYKSQQRRDLHFKDMEEAKRLPYVAAIAGAPVRAVSVMFRKPPLAERFAGGGQRLYSYAARYLIERVSAACIKARKKTEIGPAKIIFSHRTTTSYDDLRAYLDVLKTKDDCTIDWSVIDTKRISTLQHRERPGLQIADAIASSFYTAVTKKHGVCDDRYARLLHPVIHRSPDGERLGHGVKIWPSLSAEEATSYQWMVQYQKK